MRKSVSPTVAILVIVLVVLVAVVLLWKSTGGKRVAVEPGRGRIDVRTGRVITPERRGGAARGERGGQRGAQRGGRRGGGRRGAGAGQ